ncbi:MAG: hypothetical protein JNK05_01510 [Myxococcales bacterium]|nr:hypothetical protein [Myxococcales bacterium]
MPTAASAQASDAGVTAAATPQPSPTLRLDDGWTWFELESHEETRNGTRVDLGYSVSATLRVFGTAPADSAFLLVFKQGGRELGRLRCTAYAPGFERDRAFSFLKVEECRDRAVQLRAVGTVNVEIRWVDGATDAESVLATRTMEVARVAHHWGGDNLNPLPDTYYLSHHGRLLDSILAWTSFTPNDSYANAYFDNGLTGTLMFMTFAFSAAEATYNRMSSEASMRCQVNGQPFTVPNPLPANIADVRSLSVRRQFRPNPRAIGGTEVEHIHFRYATVQLPFRSEQMRANPGRYTCDLRAEGRTIRRWAWTVGADGVPAQHAEQQAGLYLGPRAILVDTTVPPDSTFDERTNPADVRAGGFFGRPWASEAMRTLAAATPTFGRPLLEYSPDPLVPAARRAISMNGAPATGGAASAAAGGASSTPSGGRRPGRRR